MTDQPDKSDLHPSVSAAMGNISQALQERDQLRDRVVRLTQDLAGAIARADTLEDVLARTTADKDYYQRYCAELYAHLRTMADGVYAALDSARKAADKEREPPDNINELRRITQKWAPRQEQ